MDQDSLVDTLLGTGDNYYRDKDYDNALTHLSEAIRLDPNCDLAYWCRGDTYLMKEQYDEAIQDFIEVIRLAPDYTPARRGHGFARRMKSQQESQNNDGIRNFFQE